MKYKIVISETAKNQLGQHILFVANVNTESAKKLKKHIMKQLSALTEMPRRYPYLNGEYLAKNHYRKMPLENRYLAIYHINDDTVFVDYILDCRQDYGWLLE